MSLRTVHAIRYISSLREGGSLPALVEADDGKRYVVKLRGAGQGALALVAEVFTGEVARLLGLPVPEIVLVELDEAFGRQEPDPEIQDLFKGSRGLNAALEFIPGVTVFDPASGDTVDVTTASRTVWLDAYTLNIDRTPRNANLLVCREQLWLIDHGASLYFHHHWPAAGDKALSSFSAIRSHILLPWAAAMSEASTHAHRVLNSGVIGSTLRLVPDSWLITPGEMRTPEQTREAYLRLLSKRLEHSGVFEEEIHRARG